MEEQWKPVPDWPEYEVSDCGNVRRTQLTEERKVAMQFGINRSQHFTG